MWWVCAKKCVCKNFPHYMAIRHTVIFVETAFWTFEFEFNWRIVWIKLLSWSFFLSSASRWLTKSKTKKPQLLRRSKLSFRDDTWLSWPEWWCLVCFDHCRHAELHFYFLSIFYWASCWALRIQNLLNTQYSLDIMLKSKKKSLIKILYINPLRYYGQKGNTDTNMQLCQLMKPPVAAACDPRSLAWQCISSNSLISKTELSNK